MEIIDSKLYHGVNAWVLLKGDGLSLKEAKDDTE
jgi:hypothetical protein